MRVIVRNMDPAYPATLFRGHGKDLRLVAEIAAGGTYWSPPDEETGAGDLYWADTARIEVEEVA